MNKTDLYIDLEWFFNQQIFLVGYAYSVTNYNQLYDENLNMYNIQRMLAPVDGYIYFYGPDIGMLEKNTGLDIRNNYRCVNLLKVFRDIMPGMDSYKLASFEEMFEINRSQRKYKSNIFKLAEDWNNPYKKQHVAYSFTYPHLHFTFKNHIKINKFEFDSNLTTTLVKIHLWFSAVKSKFRSQYRENI